MIGESTLFRPEKNGSRTFGQVLSYQWRSFGKRTEWMLQLAIVGSGSPDDQRAIGHCIGDVFERFRPLKNWRSADRGSCFPKSKLVRIDHAQIANSKVTHRARGRTDIQRISRRDQHNA